MLKTLYIENVAVIEHAELELAAGLHVLSGETGAGKSIIIDSLNAIRGGRISRDLIRTGQSKAAVSALFEDVPLRAVHAAQELGYTCEDGGLLLRRDFTVDGKNICRVNGQLATLGVLRELGSLLISIHGQHDGQNLLNEQLHIDYLDGFGRLEEPLSRYLQGYEELLSLNRKVKALSMNVEERARKLEMLQFQCQELEDAGVKQGEWDELSALRSTLIHSEKIAAGLAEAFSSLEGFEDNLGAAALTAQAEKALRGCEMFQEDIPPLTAQAAELAVLVGDLAGQVSDLLSRMAFSPQMLEDTEARLDTIAKLCSKYGCEADELSALQTRLLAEKDGVEGVEDSLDELTRQYAEKREAVFRLSQELRTARERAAKELRKRVESELKQLDMPAVQFAVQLESTGPSGQIKFTKKGTDLVRFLLSANSGEELRPLAKVASGGELSRIMLALKSVLQSDEAGTTQVFDEIDAGVSGRAASRVGQRLLRIAGQRQVLCVTHLPQIAALADYQFYISKSSKDGRTFTRVEPLGPDGRAREIARLTSGEQITETSLQGAREMLDLAEEYKNKSVDKAKNM